MGKIIEKKIEEFIIQLKNQHFFKPFHGKSSKEFYDDIGLSDEDQREVLALREKLGKEQTLPSHYGEIIYGNGPMVIQRYEIPVSQTIIHAQRKLIINAIDTLMPLGLMQAWIKQYAIGDEQVIKKFVSDLNQSQTLKVRKPCSFSDSFLYQSKELSYKNENRNCNDRRLFTYDEQKDAKQHPNYPALITATYLFRKMIVEYLNSFLAMAEKHLDAHELAQLMAMANSIRESFLIEGNFNDSVTGITRHNIMRDSNKKPSQVTQEDIACGFEFNARNGAFRNQPKCPMNSTQVAGRFACPAKSFISKMLSQSVFEGNDEKSGQLLFELFTQVEASPNYQKVFGINNNNSEDVVQAYHKPQSTLIRQWRYLAIGAVCTAITATVAANYYYQNKF